MAAPRTRRTRESPATRGSSAEAARSAAAHLARSATWAGVRAGTPVEVAGVRGRATWTFLAHVRNARTGEEWVEVVGGKAGSRAVRSFRPEQIFAPAPPGRSQGGRRASLADAPRLPL